jgi:hypothetical protein
VRERVCWVTPRSAAIDPRTERRLARWQRGTSTPVRGAMPLDLDALHAMRARSLHRSHGRSVCRSAGPGRFPWGLCSTPGLVEKKPGISTVSQMPSCTSTRTRRACRQTCDSGWSSSDVAHLSCPRKGAHGILPTLVNGARVSRPSVEAKREESVGLSCADTRRSWCACSR